MAIFFEIFRYCRCMGSPLTVKAQDLIMHQFDIFLVFILHVVARRSIHVVQVAHKVNDCGVVSKKSKTWHNSRFFFVAFPLLTCYSSLNFAHYCRTEQAYRFLL